MKRDKQSFFNCVSGNLATRPGVFQWTL